MPPIKSLALRLVTSDRLRRSPLVCLRATATNYIATTVATTTAMAFEQARRTLQTPDEFDPTLLDAIRKTLADTHKSTELHDVLAVEARMARSEMALIAWCTVARLWQEACLQSMTSTPVQAQYHMLPVVATARRVVTAASATVQPQPATARVQPPTKAAMPRVQSQTKRRARPLAVAAARMLDLSAASTVPRRMIALPGAAPSMTDTIHLQTGTRPRSTNTFDPEYADARQ